MPAPRLPQSSWDAHKEMICNLYTAENTTLQQTISRMSKEYSFNATSAQYNRQLRAWGVRKNLSREEWQAMDALAKKRKLDGKEETEFTFSGRVMSSKQLRKGLSHHVPLSMQAIQNRTTEVKHVVAQTPPSDEVVIPPRFRKLRLPWFDVQDYFKAILPPDGLLPMPIPTTRIKVRSNPGIAAITSFVQHRSFANSLPATSIVPSPQGSEEARLLDAQPSPMVYAFEQWSFISVKGSKEILLAPNNNPNEDNMDDRVKRAMEAISAREILAKCLGLSIPPSSPPCVWEESIIQQLRQHMFEQDDEKISQQVHDFCHGKDTAFHLLQFVVILSSNNMIASNHVGECLCWVIDSDNTHLLTALQHSKIPSAMFLSDRFLICAADIGETEIVRTLLEYGAGPSSPETEHCKHMALWAAVRNEDEATMHVLLEAGAKIETKQHEGSLSCTGPLSGTIRKGRTNMIRLLLERGARLHADVLATALQVEEMDLDFGSTHKSPPAGTVDFLMLVAEGQVAQAMADGVSGERFSALLLQLAAQCDDVDSIRRLLAAGTAVNTVTSFGTALINAVHHRRHAAVKVLIDGGADVNQPRGGARGWPRASLCPIEIERREYWTPLHYSSASADNESMRVLLEAGADAACLPASRHISWLNESLAIKGNEQDAEHTMLIHESRLDKRMWLMTPLQVVVELFAEPALRYHQPEVSLRLILETKPDVDAKGAFGDALQLAAIKGVNLDVLRVLLDAGANANSGATGPDGRTALQAAAESGRPDVVELLLSHGADVNAPPSPCRGLTALQAAVLSENRETFDLLRQAGGDIHAKAAKVEGMTCLQAAAAASNFHFVELLLQLGADANEPPAESMGFAALEHAIAPRGCPRGVEKVVKTLLEHGAHPDGGILRKERPAHRLLEMALTATHAERNGVVKLLLKAGASYGAHEGKLFLATIKGSRNDEDAWNRLLFLLGKGFQVPQEPECFEAATARGFSLAAIILELEGRQQSDKVIRALHSAVGRRGGNQAVYFLRALAGAEGSWSHSKEIPFILVNLLQQDKLDAANAFLDAGADINAFDANGTALDCAIDSDSVQIVQFCLGHGAHVEGHSSGSKSRTPLQKAVTQGKVHMASVLIKHGANVNAPCAGDNILTALEEAARHGRLDMIALLLHHDREPDTLHDRREKGARVAERNWHARIAKYIREWKPSED